MIKLKDILNEGIEDKLTFSWRGEYWLRIEHRNRRGENATILSIHKNDGFGGVTRLGSTYSIQYEGKGYTFKDLLNQRDIKKKLKESLKDMKTKIEDLKKSLPYQDGKGYRDYQEEISSYEAALKDLKSYI